MRRWSIILVCLLCLEIGHAASVMDAFITIPDTVCPYFTAEQRMQLITPPYRPVRNVLEGQSQLDSISADAQYMRITFSNGFNIELQVIANQQYLLKENICAPVCTSVSRIYTSEWILVNKKVTEWQDAESQEVNF